MAALLVAAACLTSACDQPAAESDPRGERVFERTKRTKATYALYSWNWVKGADGAARQGWSAEFHRGSQHRVETPDVRIVADCANDAGSMFTVATNEIENGPAIAQAACGINSNQPVARLEWLGEQKTRFGLLERVRLGDGEFERDYAVDQAGILIASEYFPLDPDDPACVQAEALAVEHILPEGDIFSPASLRQSYVPGKFRTAPRAPVGDLWIGDRRCA